MHGHAVRAVQLAGQRGPADARRSRAARARHALEPAAGGHVAHDAVVLGIRDQDGVVAVDAQVLRAVQGRRARVPVNAIRALAAGRVHDRADAARAVDDAQGVAVALEHVEVALPVVGRRARIR